jgi:hypothetical protein
MAKKMRKKAAKKATKKVAKKATRKTTKKAAKAKVKVIARKKSTGKKNRKPPPQSIPQMVEGAFTAVLDTLSDAERLHRKLDPGVSREPE